MPTRAGETDEMVEVIKKRIMAEQVVAKEDDPDEKYIQEQLDKMTAEDIAAGRGAPSAKALAVYRENISSHRRGRLQPNQTARAPETSNKNVDKVDSKYRAPDEMSFSEVIEPFYGDQTKEEIGKATAYADKAFPRFFPNDQRRDMGPWDKRMLERATDGMGIDEKIKIKHNAPEDADKPNTAGRQTDGAYRANFTSSRRDPETGERTPDTVNMARPSDYSGDAYGQVLNHEMGHSMYRTNNEGEDVADKNYFRKDGELVTELAHAQRQRFKNKGERFTKESFESFIKDAAKNPKMLDGYAPTTRTMFEHMIDTAVSPDEKDQKRFKEAAKLIPALVQNEPTPRRRFFSA